MGLVNRNSMVLFLMFKVNFLIVFAICFKSCYRGLKLRVCCKCLNVSLQTFVPKKIRSYERKFMQSYFLAILLVKS